MNMPRPKNEHSDRLHPPQMYNAHYCDVPIPSHRGNPLIETLPPIRSREEIITQMRRMPPYHDDERRLPAQIRLHLLPQAARFFQPLPQHVELAETISMMLRDGYSGRNPAQPSYLPSARQRLPSVLAYRPDDADEPLATSGFTLIGESGIGKTRGIVRVLRLYPQVIVHSQYQRQRFSHLQVVYLKINCPHDGSRKALCKEFFRAIDRCLGTSYFERYAASRRVSIDSLVLYMSNICLLHHIGVLVIDEIQNLREAKAQDVESMLNFFTQLDNEIQVPVVLIGTPRARPILAGRLQRARRAEGQGGLTWNPMGFGEHWDLFVRTLWRYQYTHHRSELTPQMSTVLWDESQGIADVAIKLYFLTQIEAITCGTESITPTAIHMIARERLRFVQPFLQVLRERDERRLSTDPAFDDLSLPSVQRAAAGAAREMRLAPQSQAEIPIGVPSLPLPVSLAPHEPMSSDWSDWADTTPDVEPHTGTAITTTIGRQEDQTPTDGPAASATRSAEWQEGIHREQAGTVGPINNDTSDTFPTRPKRALRRGKASGSHSYLPQQGLVYTFETRASHVTLYEALRAIGHIRPATEYLTDDSLDDPRQR